MRILRQLARWSALGWLLSLVITGFYFAVSDQEFFDALFGGALFASIALVGVGAMSFGGGGISWTGQGYEARRTERERWDEPGAVLTPLGAALLVVPQLLGIAYIAGRMFSGG